jgi:transcriptional regulator with XRE-family HTH domain
VTEANLAQQRMLYGEPLADTTARVMTALGLTQAKLAQVLQISAPMLSQLISAHRVKIGNPAVVHRLQALGDLAGQAPRMTPEAIAARLVEIHDEQVTMTGQPPAHPDASRAAATQAHLRSIATPAELLALAAATTNTRLAELLESAADRR